MSTRWQEGFRVGLDSAGMLLRPQEFDAIEDYNENYRYELINGVLVVTEFSQPDIASANDPFSYLIRGYFNRLEEPGRYATLPTQYIYSRTNRRIADRLIWCGLKQMPDVRHDPPDIAIEYLSRSRRSRARDTAQKRQECREAGVQEFWSIDFCKRTMTVVLFSPGPMQEQVVQEAEGYMTPLLPGFQVPLARVIKAALEYDRTDDPDW